MHRSTTTLIAIILCCLGLLSLVAAQAQCGPGLGSCTDGNCCSQAGFCGAGELYCGAGCQAGFGAPCVGGGQSPSLPTTSVPPTTDPTVPPTLSPTTPTVEPTTLTTLLPTTTTATTLTTTDAATTTSASSTSARGTFQLQPTGKPSSGSSAGVDSRLALVIVFLAGLFMI
ncbi:hypothetical protein BG015_000910 [Linnemannia schmuckeri]|uniref:Chitin-binding type-1 domain-containing protein n=1 Tax=Linnemannia schmuckeri TaxID=64567 RepID=A0A9P5RSW5_9FUNG|nr:hypothetical protein BG015_000910 [Linnemannia schmuckeri]